MEFLFEFDWDGWWISDKRKDFTLRRVCWVHIGRDYVPEIPNANIYVCIIGPFRFQVNKG